MKRYCSYFFFPSFSPTFSAAICASCLIPLTDHITNLTVELIKFTIVVKILPIFAGYHPHGRAQWTSMSAQDKWEVQKERAKIKQNNFSRMHFDLCSPSCVCSPSITVAYAQLLLMSGTHLERPRISQSFGPKEEDYVWIPLSVFQNDEDKLKTAFVAGKKFLHNECVTIVSIFICENICSSLSEIRTKLRIPNSTANWK